MLHNKVLLFLLPLFFIFQFSNDLKAQYSPGYYRFPLEEGKQHFFAGTMGELRASHFHGGLDIKTSNQIGWPVYAAADGYIFRLKVASSGYGNVLYMKHPNGQTTVYAHLDRFHPEIAKYLLESQYQKETFSIQLFPKEGQFAFKKGEIIAWAGNSGSSTAPHLHFEIRDEQQRPLNPVKFNFPELVDNISPTPLLLKVRPLNIRSRVEGQFPPLTLELQQKGNEYVVEKPIRSIGEIGVEVNMYDRANGTVNKYGINRVVMEVNGQKIYEHIIDQIPFSMNDYLQVFTDYEAYAFGKGRFQRIYQTEANKLPIYPQKEKKGIFQINSGETRKVTLKLYDSFENETRIRFTLVGNPDDPLQEQTFSQADSLTVMGSVLYFRHAHQESIRKQLARVYSPSLSYHLRPSYEVEQQDVYLWNMNLGIPDSIVFQDVTLFPKTREMVLPNSQQLVKGQQTEIQFFRRTLFDTLFFHFEEKGDTIQIGSPTVPLKNVIEVRFTPKTKFTNKEKAAAYAVYPNGKTGFQGGEWEGNTLVFRTGYFGKYTIGFDTEKPEILPVIINREKIAFRVKDENSGIKEIKATLNGKWILMNQDLKKDYIESERMDKSIPLKGTFRLEVTDNLGNLAVYEKEL